MGLRSDREIFFRFNLSLAIPLNISNNIPTMAKSPFEKVKSLVERRKLFEALLREGSDILCKGEGESLFHFKPANLSREGWMQGSMIAVEKSLEHTGLVLGNFSVSGERYFFSTEIELMKNGDTQFVVSCEVYQLQRRSSLRLHVQQSHGVYLAITEFQGKAIYVIAQIADLSAGGARIFFSDLDSPVAATVNSKNPNLRAGDRFKAILHLGQKRSLEVNVEVKHIQQAVHLGQIVEHIGIEFIELTSVLRNRLVAMTMDLQYKMISED